MKPQLREGLHPVFASCSGADTPLPLPGTQVRGRKSPRSNWPPRQQRSGNCCVTRGTWLPLAFILSVKDGWVSVWQGLLTPVCL